MAFLAEQANVYRITQVLNARRAPPPGFFYRVDECPHHHVSLHTLIYDGLHHLGYPRVINLYTNMYVPGYGVGQALDTGGAIKGLRIDLGYSDDDFVLWYNWVDVYLLLPIPPYDEMIWLLWE